MVWESIKRRRGRFAFVVIALTLGIGTVVASRMLSMAMQREVGDQLDQFGANIVVTPRSTRLDLGYGGLVVGDVAVEQRELRDSDADAIRTIPNKRNINAVAPTLLGVADLDGKRGLIMGVRFRDESRVKSWWRLRGRFARTADQAMLGAEAAERLRKKDGDTVSLAGRSLLVTGVLEPTGSIDDQAVFADLAVTQHALGKPGSVTAIEVSALCKGCPIEDIVRQIGAVLPHARVAPLRQAVAAREQAVLQITRFGLAVSIIVLVVGALVIASTITAAVAERTQEIGILRAVGFRRAHVARVVLLESMATSMIGGALGWMAGAAVASSFGRSVAALSAAPTVEWWTAAAAVAGTAVLGLLSGAYPAVKAANLDPSIALRHM
jgi:putative ABC transport system permease protein